jgi:glyoxylate reductase
MGDGGRVLVTRPIPEVALGLLGRHLEVVAIDPEPGRERAAVMAALAACDGVLAQVTDRVDGELLDAGPRLRVVANMAVGVDNVDLAAAGRRGIAVTNTPGVLTESTADLAFALILAASRRTGEGERAVRSGRFRRWLPMAFLGQDVHGKVLGIVGMGRIGAAVGRRGRLGFAMRVLYHDRRRNPDAERELEAEPVPLDRLLAEADVVSLHLPLAADTRHLIDAAALARMKPTAVLVNTGRGAVVDEEALARALRRRRIFAAGLDVHEHEPRVHPDLVDLDSVVLLPHLGSATEETRAAMALAAARNLVAALAGERPPDLVEAAVEG